MQTIPDNIADATDALDGIGRLLQAKQWERAAIVYAFTRDATGEGRNSKKVSRTTNLLTCNEFAALGIQGLKSDSTVRKYRANWQQAIDAGHADPIGPGDDYAEPDMGWPPTGNGHGDADKIREDSDPEDKAEVVAKHLSDPEVAAQPEAKEAAEDAVASDPGSVARVNQKWEQENPKPPTHKPEPGAVDAVASLTSLEAAVARLDEATPEAVEIVQSGQAPRDLLDEPIRSIRANLEFLEMARADASNADEELAEILDGGK